MSENNNVMDELKRHLGKRYKVVLNFEDEKKKFDSLFVEGEADDLMGLFPGNAFLRGYMGPSALLDQLLRWANAFELRGNNLREAMGKDSTPVRTVWGRGVIEDDCKALGKALALELFRLNAHIFCDLEEGAPATEVKINFLNTFSQELKEGEDVEQILEEAMKFLSGLESLLYKEYNAACRKDLLCDFEDVKVALRCFSNSCADVEELLNQEQLPNA